jgi:16S rRNA (uracil1498-N3)-methyltransferase
MPKCSHEHTATTRPSATVRLTRCFVPRPLAAESSMLLPAGPSMHIARVLRLRVGALLTLFDGRGGEFEASILALERGGVRVQLGAHRAVEREAPVSITLLQCLVRAERMDFIVQKATELGVAAIVPLASRHSVVRLDDPGAQRRQRHWQAVAVSACEQCGRNRIPELQSPRALDRGCAESDSPAAPGARLLLLPEGPHTLAGAVVGLSGPATGLHLSLLSGPEGGFSADEIALAQQHGFVACRLGPRVLRAETAPLAALATIQALIGDFGASDAATT